MSTANPPARYVDGYPSLAAFIASDRDGTTSIYKRFNRLAARNLLLLQSELADLQAQLDQFDLEDQGTKETMQSLRNWEDFKNRADQSRMELVRRIRVVLKDYRDALLAESTLASLPAPDSDVLDAFNFNFNHGVPNDPKYKNKWFHTLGGNSALLYDDPDDLVALHTIDDRFTRFLQHRLGFLFKAKPTAEGMSANNGDQIRYASSRNIVRAISVFSTLLAITLLIVPIIILYFVHSNRIKLALVALFAIVFGMCVGLLSNAKRAEIFASTAAYAAVLVVFVSGDLGSSTI